MTNFIRFIMKVYYKLFFKINVDGYKNIPKNDGFIIVSNHISNHDPLVVAVIMKNLIYALGKKELFSNFLTKKLFNWMNVIPVDRKRLDINAMKESIKVLKKKEMGLLIFPEGTRNFNEKPLVSTPGSTMLAYKTKKPIVPISIDSTYKIFSKINVTIYPPVYVKKENKGKMKTKDFINKNNEILEKIYKNMELYKKRSCYEGKRS
ncbi:MAG: lysophospholipid acyltransferase family protein [Bacillota bacterium]